MARQIPPPTDDALRKLRADDVIAERYRLVDVLGRGGMGVVWRAQDETLELPVALKFLPEVLVRDAGAMEQLKSETRNALRLTHPNILRVHNIVEDRARSVACIAMELATGGNLDQIRAEQPDGRFEPWQIHGWLDELCGALIHAHEVAGVVHRDLKPANLLLDETGRLKVADFGFSARASESFTQLTHSKSAGTLPYASPQQTRGERATPSDDLYALGVTIYCLLAGRPPFFRGDILHQLFESTPPRINALRQEAGKPAVLVSEGWEKLVAELLAKDPAKRPVSARAVAARLTQLRNEKATPRRSTASPARLAQAEIEDGGPPGINWRLWIGIWISAALLMSTAFWVTDRPRKAPLDSPIPQATDVEPPESVWRQRPPLPFHPKARTQAAAPGAPEATPAPEAVTEIKPTATPEPPEPPAPSPEQRYRDFVSEAKQLRASGSNEFAVARLREAIGLAPDNPEAMAELALTFERMGKSERAADEWKRILAMGESAGTFYVAAEARIQMSVAAPTPAPPAPPAAELPSTEAVSALNPKAVLGLGAIERDDALDSQGLRLTLRIQIKARPAAKISAADVDISVLLFDEVGEGRVVRTEADVSYKFADPPVDWAQGGDETIEVSYDRTASMPAKSKRRFFGYIVRVYHRGELQDARAEPGLLGVKYPAPERFTPEAAASAPESSKPTPRPIKKRER